MKSSDIVNVLQEFNTVQRRNDVSWPLTPDRVLLYMSKWSKHKELNENTLGSEWKKKFFFSFLLMLGWNATRIASWNSLFLVNRDIYASFIFSHLTNRSALIYTKLKQKKDKMIFQGAASSRVRNISSRTASNTQKNSFISCFVHHSNK